MADLGYHDLGVKVVSVKSERRIAVGVDLGKSNDPTAIAVIEKTVKGAEGEDGWYWAGRNQWTQRKVIRYGLRALKRLPLGLDYVSQVQEVGEVLWRVPGDADLIIDVTGVGAPVVDLFKTAGLKPVSVTITAGDGETRVGHDEFRVSKLKLISQLEALLHAGEMVIAKDTQAGDMLFEEMKNFQRTVTQTGQTRFEGRVGKHDDLVLGTAIAAWWLARPLSTISQIPTRF